MQKGDKLLNSNNLNNLNNWRLGRLKVHVITKKVLHWWRKPYKKIQFLSDQSL